MNGNIPDPWDDSDDRAGTSVSMIWAQVTLERHLVVLEKGVGRMPYDPTTHADRKPVKAVDIYLSPLPEMPPISEKALEKKMVNFEDKWVRITRPSLKGLGVTDLKTVSGRWAKIEVVETGQTYQSKTNGKTYSETAFKFLAFFADEDAARADYRAAQGIPIDTTNAQPAMTPANGNGANAGGEKAKALPFMKVVVRKAFESFGPDMDLIAAEIAKFPLVKANFTVDSPEVQELVFQLAQAKAA